MSFLSRCALAIPVILLCGCAAQAPKQLYGWGSYEELLYVATTKSDSMAPQQQIETMQADRARLSAAGQRLPPGWRVHLANLYTQTGHVDEARAELEAEKAAFPESTVFCNTLLSHLGRPQQVTP
jgi:hypothetical protein